MWIVIKERKRGELRREDGNEGVKEEGMKIREEEEGEAVEEKEERME